MRLLNCPLLLSTSWVPAFGLAAVGLTVGALTVGGLTVGGLIGCRAAESTDSSLPKVVCTTTMIGDLVREIAGGDVDVTVLFGTTVDPHLFRPTRDDLKTLISADLVFLSGYHLEGNMTLALERIATADVRVIALAEEITREDDVLRDEDAKAVDPHLWMDVALWSRGTEPIQAALSELVPAKTDEFKARASALSERLIALDQFVASSMASIPENARVLVTAHDAFQYFGRRYGIEVEAIQGISTASEAGMRDVNSLVQLLVERKIPAVFFESTVSERNVRALVEGASALGHTVKVGGVLHSDAPGDARTYEGMIEHNTRTIAKALGGTTDSSALVGSTAETAAEVAR